MSAYEQQAREALTQTLLMMLAPAKADEAECRHDIAYAVDRVRHKSLAEAAHKAFGSKEGKAQLTRYRNALHELQAAYSGLGPAIKPWFSLAETAHVVGTETVIDRELKKVENVERSVSKRNLKPKRSAITAKAGVAAAHDLLCWYGHKPGATKGGLWERVAQLLAGSNTGLHVHMRAYLRTLDDPGVPRVKKRRTPVVEAKGTPSVGTERYFVSDEIDEIIERFADRDSGT
jgi:hypothetical protein